MDSSMTLETKGGKLRAFRGECGVGGMHVCGGTLERWGGGSACAACKNNYAIDCVFRNSVAVLRATVREWCAFHDPACVLGCCSERGSFESTSGPPQQLGGHVGDAYSKIPYSIFRGPLHQHSPRQSTKRTTTTDKP